MPSKKTAVKRVHKGGRKAKDAPTTEKKKSPGRGTSARARGVTVDDYLVTLPEDQLAIAKRLAEIIAAAAPGATSSLKWGQPVWECGGPLAFLRGSKKHVTFGFWRGAELTDEKGLLMGAGTKMRHLKIEKIERVDAAAITNFVKQAVALNKELGDPTRGT